MPPINPARNAPPGTAPTPVGASAAVEDDGPLNAIGVAHEHLSNIQKAPPKYDDHFFVSSAPASNTKTWGAKALDRKAQELWRPLPERRAWGAAAGSLYAASLAVDTVTLGLTHVAASLITRMVKAKGRSSREADRGRNWTRSAILHAHAEIEANLRTAFTDARLDAQGLWVRAMKPSLWAKKELVAQKLQGLNQRAKEIASVGWVDGRRATQAEDRFLLGLAAEVKTAPPVELRVDENKLDAAIIDAVRRDDHLPIYRALAGASPEDIKALPSATLMDKIARNAAAQGKVPKALLDRLKSEVGLSARDEAIKSALNTGRLTKELLDVLLMGRRLKDRSVLDAAIKGKHTRSIEPLLGAWEGEVTEKQARFIVRENAASPAVLLEKYTQTSDALCMEAARAGHGHTAEVLIKALPEGMKLGGELTRAVVLGSFRQGDPLAALMARKEIVSPSCAFLAEDGKKILETIAFDRDAVRLTRIVQAIDRFESSAAVTTKVEITKILRPLVQETGAPSEGKRAVLAFLAEWPCDDAHCVEAVNQGHLDLARDRIKMLPACVTPSADLTLALIRSPASSARGVLKLLMQNPLAQSPFAAYRDSEAGFGDLDALVRSKELNRLKTIFELVMTHEGPRGSTAVRTLAARLKCAADEARDGTSEWLAMARYLNGLGAGIECPIKYVNL